MRGQLIHALAGALFDSSSISEETSLAFPYGSARRLVLHGADLSSSVPVSGSAYLYLRPFSGRVYGQVRFVTSSTVEISGSQKKKVSIA